MRKKELSIKDILKKDNSFILTFIKCFLSLYSISILLILSLSVKLNRELHFVLYPIISILFIVTVFSLSLLVLSFVVILMSKKKR